MIALRALTADDWGAWRKMRLQALADAPGAFGSTLAEWQGAGDTEERWRRRLTDVPLNVLAFIEEEPAGMVSATALDASGTAELISMWVAPFARGRGVGDALIHAVVSWAQRQGARRVALDVVASNEPATALYRRNGFLFVDETPACGKCERRMERIIRPASPAAS